MRRHGFTLVELMVTVLIVSIIGIYVGYSLSANERAYQAVDQTAESQQNLRAVLDLMERDIRHAALMMPEAASACGVDRDGGPDTLYLADGSVIDPDDDTSEYPGVEVTAGVVALNTVTFTVDSMVVEVGAPVRAAVDTDGDGTNDSDFRPNGGIIFFDPDLPTRGVACGHITTLNAAAKTMQVEVAAIFDTGGPVITNLRAVPANEYRIVGTDLQWNGTVLAGNIEDLQTAWVFDLDDDNVVDANEIHGDGNGPDYDSAAQNAALLRELDVNLVARSRLPDETFTRGIPQALENRDGSGFVNDGYRRRVVTARVRLRNLGLRS